MSGVNEQQGLPFMIYCSFVAHTALDSVSLDLSSQYGYDHCGLSTSRLFKNSCSGALRASPFHKSLNFGGHRPPLQPLASAYGVFPQPVSLGQAEQDLSREQELFQGDPMHYATLSAFERKTSNGAAVQGRVLVLHRIRVLGFHS